MKNPNRVQAGKLAKRRGTQAEQEFDIACRYYRNNYLIDWHPTFPEFVVLGHLEDGVVRGFFKDKGTADRVISLAKFNGKTCWAEIKSFAAKGKKTLSDEKDTRQYDMMLAAVEDGQAMAFYAVRWKWNKIIEWRLYPITGLKKEEGKIIFERKKGFLILSPFGWPDWMETLNVHIF